MDDGADSSLIFSDGQFYRRGMWIYSLLYFVTGKKETSCFQKEIFFFKLNTGRRAAKETLKLSPVDKDLLCC